MKVLYCWRCHGDVAMLDEAEFSEISLVHRACTRMAKQYREQHRVRLDETPLTEFYAPLQQAYARLGGSSVADPHHILKHRLANLGPPCRRCGRPLRTPRARLCAACGNQTAA